MIKIIGIIVGVLVVVFGGFFISQFPLLVSGDLKILIGIAGVWCKSLGDRVSWVI